MPVAMWKQAVVRLHWTVMTRAGYPSLDVSSWDLLGVEAAGRREHHWLRDPSSDESWLWKPVTLHDAHQQGEDWSEKIASEVAVLMGIPAARVELAQRDGRHGCISRDLRPRGWDLQPGAVLLAGVVEGYESRVKGRPGHTLENIRRALGDYAAPPSAECPVEFRAFDVFVGYVVFDAVIGNRDRHDENWAVVLPPVAGADVDALCGSYDHASSLGFNLLDAERERRLADNSVEAWVRRGTAYKFEHDPSARPPTLVALATAALEMCRPPVASHWRDSVAAISMEAVAEIVHAVRGLSDAAARFAAEVVRTNRSRVLDGD
jgi:hypothetical protein